MKNRKKVEQIMQKIIKRGTLKYLYQGQREILDMDNMSNMNFITSCMSEIYKIETSIVKMKEVKREEINCRIGDKIEKLTIVYLDNGEIYLELTNGMLKSYSGDIYRVREYIEDDIEVAKKMIEEIGTHPPIVSLKDDYDEIILIIEQLEKSNVLNKKTIKQKIKIKENII